MVAVSIKHETSKVVRAASSAGRSRSGKTAVKKVTTTSKHLGWATFNRNGGAVIEEVDGSGMERVIGTSVVTPQVRIRPASKFPKSVARVRREHNLLFDNYKSVHRQVRALLAMGITFVIRSGGCGVLIDRHPDFARNLIDKEVARWKREAVNDLAQALLTIVKALSDKRTSEAKKTRRTTTKSITAKSDEDVTFGPYEQQRMLAQTMKPVMPKDLYDGIMQFLDKRRDESQEASIIVRTADDIERYEVD